MIDLLMVMCLAGATEEPPSHASGIEISSTIVGSLATDSMTHTVAMPSTAQSPQVSSQASQAPQSSQKVEAPGGQQVVTEMVEESVGQKDKSDERRHSVNLEISANAERQGVSVRSSPKKADKTSEVVRNDAVPLGPVVAQSASTTAGGMDEEDCNFAGSGMVTMLLKFLV